MIQSMAPAPSPRPQLSSSAEGGGAHANPSRAATWDEGAAIASQSKGMSDQELLNVQPMMTASDLNSLANYHG